MITLLTQKQRSIKQAEYSGLLSWCTHRYEAAFKQLLLKRKRVWGSNTSFLLISEQTQGRCTEEHSKLPKPSLHTNRSTSKRQKQLATRELFFSKLDPKFSPLRMVPLFLSRNKEILESLGVLLREAHDVSV